VGAGGAAGGAVALGADEEADPLEEGESQAGSRKVESRSARAGRRMAREHRTPHGQLQLYRALAANGGLVNVGSGSVTLDGSPSVLPVFRKA
jgi:hypothetical protein